MIYVYIADQASFVMLGNFIVKYTCRIYCKNSILSGDYKQCFNLEIIYKIDHEFGAIVEDYLLKILYFLILF